MNVGKTKELVLDARKTTNVFVPVKVNNEPVDVVSNFKYLGTLIDNKLGFSDNTDDNTDLNSKNHSNAYPVCES